MDGSLGAKPILGKYELLARLAAGGMGEIFLARLKGDGGFEKLLAIKRLLPHLAADDHFVTMFLDEARITAQLSHPNICGVFELGKVNNQYFIAMEYLDGVDFGYLIKSTAFQMLDIRFAVALICQACEGLTFAHESTDKDGQLTGIIHRDISPGNLFVTDNGLVKILDFGIAKARNSMTKTQTGIVKGKYKYMSPEQLDGHKIDHRSDIFSLGIVAFEILSGQKLFDRPNEYQVFQAIKTLPIPTLTQVRSDIPAQISDVVARALSRPIGARYTSANEFGEALRQACLSLGDPLSPGEVGRHLREQFAEQLTARREKIREIEALAQTMDSQQVTIDSLTTTNMAQAIESSHSVVAALDHAMGTQKAIELLGPVQSSLEAMPSLPNISDPEETGWHGTDQSLKIADIGNKDAHVARPKRPKKAILAAVLIGCTGIAGIFAYRYYAITNAARGPFAIVHFGELPRQTTVSSQGKIIESRQLKTAANQQHTFLLSSPRRLSVNWTITPLPSEKISFRGRLPHHLSTISAAALSFPNASDSKWRKKTSRRHADEVLTALGDYIQCAESLEQPNSTADGQDVSTVSAARKQCAKIIVKWHATTFIPRTIQQLSSQYLRALNASETAGIATVDAPLQTKFSGTLIHQQMMWQRRDLAAWQKHSQKSTYWYLLKLGLASQKWLWLGRQSSITANKAGDALLTAYTQAADHLLRRDVQVVEGAQAFLAQAKKTVQFAGRRTIRKQSDDYWKQARLLHNASITTFNNMIVYQ